MPTCKCGRLIKLGAGSHNRHYDQHCSRYCYIYYQNPKAHPNVRISKSKHHKNHTKRPSIVTPCDTCHTPFELTDHEKEGNKHFCSKSCFHKVLTTKNGHRDWTILKIIQNHGPITSGEIARRYCSNNTNLNSYAIGSILRIYKARGIINCNTPTGRAGNIHRLYQLNTQHPLGDVVANKVKLCQ